VAAQTVTSSAAGHDAAHAANLGAALLGSATGADGTADLWVDRDTLRD